MTAIMTRPPGSGGRERIAAMDRKRAVSAPLSA